MFYRDTDCVLSAAIFDLNLVVERSGLPSEMRKRGFGAGNFKVTQRLSARLVAETQNGA